MKKIFFLVLALLNIFFLVACKNNSNAKKVGILQFVSHESIDKIVNGIQDGLKEINMDLDVDLKNANGDNLTALNIAQKFVSDEYDLIIAVTTGGAQAAFNATREKNIPVVFVGVSDPIGAGIIKSKENPETNMTGISDFLDVEAELELVKNLLPDAKKIGVIYNASEINSCNELELLKLKEKDFGYKVETNTISSTMDINLAMDNILEKVDVMINILDNTVMSGLDIEIKKADEKNIPVIGAVREQVEKGALVSNSFEQYDLGYETKDMIKKILEGESANNIKVKNCETKKLLINKDKAEKFKIKIPEGANLIE